MTLRVGSGVPASVREIAHDLWSDGRGPILLGVAGGWFLSLGVRLIFPALLPHIRETFSLSLTVAGLLITVLWVGYALGQFPGGIIGDRLGEGNALVISSVVSGTMIAIVAIATNVWMLFFVVACFGFSTALFGPARFTILSAIYDDNDGTAIGLTLSAGEAGNAILPVFAGVIAALFTWRLGFGTIVPLFFLTAVFLSLYVPKKLNESSAVDTLSWSSLRYVIRGIGTRSIVIVTTIHLFMFFVYQGFTGFYPTYLIEMKGLSSSAASAMFGLFFAVGIIVQPLAGAGGDRIGQRTTLLFVTGISAVTMAILPFVGEFAAIVLVTVVASTQLGVTPLTQTYLVNALPSDMKGSGLGLIRTVHIGLGATGPILVGAVADLGYFDQAFVILGVIALGALALTFVMPSR